MEKSLIIAIDGHSSCGKSTLAKDLAKELGYIYVDTGAMYRAVTLYFIQNGIDFELENDVDYALGKINIAFHKHNNQTQHTYLNGKDVEKEIRSPEVAKYVSPVAAISAVRKKLVKEQREMGLDKGIVMDGRDIGTVVFPNAKIKLFLTANVETRAQRRYDELILKGHSVTFDQVYRNLQERDRIDSTRLDSPLKPAEDAIHFDNSEIGIEEQFDVVLELIKSRM